MLFSSIAAVQGNTVNTTPVVIECTVNLCLVIVQQALSMLALMAASPADPAAFHITWVHVNRVLASCRYQEQLTVAFTPAAPLPLPGPFPAAVPCAAVTARAISVPGAHTVAIVVLMTAVFRFPTAAGLKTVTAEAAPLVRVFPASAPQRGDWLATATVQCVVCLAVASTLPQRHPAADARFSHETRVSANRIGAWLARVRPIIPERM